MTISMYGSEGFDNPILDNKYFFCFKNPALTEIVIRTLSEAEVNEWKARFTSFPENDCHMTKEEGSELVKALNPENTGGFVFVLAYAAAKTYNHNHPTRQHN